MSLAGKILEWLTLPEARGIDLDAPESTQLHAAIIRQKPFLRNLYMDFYQEFHSMAAAVPLGPLVELGSGGGFLQEILPEVKTSDVLFLPRLDLCFEAQRLPFKDRTISGLFLVNVFHHLQEAFLFLQEADRCSKPGGKVLMIEPANTAWGRFIYSRFHHEPFEPDGDWRIKKEGPLSSANGALPWIVFGRDREKFSQVFPRLTLKKMRCHTPFLYLLSGGVSKRQLVPSATYPFFKGLESVLRVLVPSLAMFMTVELEKV